jgi:YegS/Rv2252/BmrU family lipid kinase
LSKPSTWFTIINPKAGSGRGLSDWPIVKQLLHKNGVEFEFHLTQRKFHAVELTVWAINNGYEKILVVGGDGTLNEVVNGVFIQRKRASSEILIGVVGVGTGNDWQRMYSIPRTYEGKVEAIKFENTFLQDVGRVEFFESRVNQVRYFANTAGVGFDAEVANSTNRLKESGRKGKLLYMISLLHTLISYKSSLVGVLIDNQGLGGKTFSITLGIGRYSGGGLLQVPNAQPDDGLFDITIISNIKRWDVLRNIYRLFNGTILKHPKIHGYQGKNIFVSSRPPLNLEADGESLGTSPFKFSIIPKSIKVVVGADFRSVNRD